MCAPMKERRYRPGVAVVDGKIYVLGGEEGWDRSDMPDFTIKLMTTIFVHCAEKN